MPLFIIRPDCALARYKGTLYAGGSVFAQYYPGHTMRQLLEQRLQ